MVTYAYYWKLLTPTLILRHSVTESNRSQKELHFIVILEQRKTDLPFHLKHFAQSHTRVRAARE